MPAAVVAGAWVWLAVVAAASVWLIILAVAPRRLLGPKPVLRWLLASFVTRLAVLAAWSVAGWHVFCQRP
ncbi:MAG TPA: hypothetical protein VGL48_09725 [Acidimicrobiales bacterium]|jgi:hypothetical protein